MSGGASTFGLLLRQACHGSVQTFHALGRGSKDQLRGCSRSNTFWSRRHQDRLRSFKRGLMALSGWHGTLRFIIFPERGQRLPKVEGSKGHIMTTVSFERLRFVWPDSKTFGTRAFHEDSYHVGEWRRLHDQGLRVFVDATSKQALLESLFVH